jgi:hypothetical protein
MSTALLVVLIVGGSLVFLVGMFAVIYAIAMKVRSGRRFEVAPGTEQATYGGGDGDGFGRVRGLRQLAITEDAVTFDQFVTDRRLVIPRASVIGTSVDMTLRVPGRISRGTKPWLTISWTTPDGRVARSCFMVAAAAATADRLAP